MSEAYLQHQLESLDWPHRQHSHLVRNRGIAWHVQRMGEGPGLLLLHGTGASTHSFRALMPLLAQRFTVLAPDLPGHAFTTAPARFVPSLPSLAGALRSLLEALKFTPRVLVGHSAGAAVLAQLVLEGSLAPSLLVGLAAALVPFRGPARAVLVPAAKLLARSRLAPHLLALQSRDPRSVAQMIRSTGSVLPEADLALYQALARRPSHVKGALSMMANWDLEPLHARLELLRAPVLLLAGARDLAVPLHQQHALARRLPHAHLEVLGGVGHLLHEEAPEAVARPILETS